MSTRELPPLKSVAYTIVMRGSPSNLLNEFDASYRSLRRFHPDVQVMVYYHNLNALELEYCASLSGVMTFAIGVDPSAPQSVNQIHAKLDALLLTPGDTLFLDTATEVFASLDECFRSELPWLHDVDDVSSLYVPESWTDHLYTAKMLLGDGEDEVKALSTVLGSDFGTLRHLISHYADQKLASCGEWFERVHGASAESPLEVGNPLLY